MPRVINVVDDLEGFLHGLEENLSRVDDDGRLVIEDAQPVWDGGHWAFQASLPAWFIAELVRTDRLFVHNPRPESKQRMDASGNPLVPAAERDGRKEYYTVRNVGKSLQERVQANKALFGNVTFNVDPKSAEGTYDPVGRTLTLSAATVLNTGIDSVTRCREIVFGVKNPFGSFNPDTPISVRIWFVPESEVNDRFADFNGVSGQAVNKSVRRNVVQVNSHERVAQGLLQHIGLGLVEFERTSVARKSPKLVATNTMMEAVIKFFDLPEEATEDDERIAIAYLVNFWNHLVVTLPEYSKVSASVRESLRGSSVSTSALAIHGLIGLANFMRENNVPLATLKELDHTVVVLNSATGDNEVVSWFDYRNPLWTQEGILVSSTNAAGDKVLNLRNAFQSREAMRNILIKRVTQ